MAPASSPATVNVWRAQAVECVHRVDIVVVDETGATVAAWGDPDRILYPRSAIKALQAIVMVRSGAAEAFGFEPRHLALACASHNAEPAHVDCAREMLQRIGVSEQCLECGSQLPHHPEDLWQLAGAGKPAGAVHNNCSGKHAGFLAHARHGNHPVKAYTDPDHPVQQDVAALLAELTRTPHGAENRAIDGCSVPTYRIPMTRLAHAFARFGTGSAADPDTAGAMTILRDSCFAHPDMVAGRDRACTRLMRLLNGEAFVKIGAEGVYAASLPGLGLGIALKVHDGAMRAAEATIATLLERYLAPRQAVSTALAAIAAPQLHNLGGLAVGRVEVVL